MGIKSPMDRVHGQSVHPRRVQTLVNHLSDIIPQHANVLDVGSGDGLLAYKLTQIRPDLTIQGIDVLVRPNPQIPVSAFDGNTIPFADGTFDVVLFVDVLHHTLDPMILLREARRTTHRHIVLKDHTRDGFLAGPTLRFMDWVGNSSHGVALPYNYWPKSTWLTAFADLGLHSSVWRDDLGLYPGITDRFFGRSLHFITRLDLEAAI